MHIYIYIDVFLQVFIATYKQNGLYLSAHWVGPNLRKAQGVEALTGNHVIRLAYYTA